MFATDRGGGNPNQYGHPAARAPDVAYLELIRHRGDRSKFRRHSTPTDRIQPPMPWIPLCGSASHCPGPPFVLDCRRNQESVVVGTAFLVAETMNSGKRLRPIRSATTVRIIYRETVPSTLDQLRTRREPSEEVEPIGGMAQRSMMLNQISINQRSAPLSSGFQPRVVRRYAAR